MPPGRVVSRLLAGALTTEAALTNNPEAKQAEKRLEDRLRGPKRINETVIVSSTSVTVDDPAFREYVLRIRDRVRALGPEAVQDVTSFYDSRSENLVSKDRRATLAPVVMAGNIAALLILLVVFGAVIAGLIPVLVGAAAIVLGLAIVAVAGQAVLLSFFVPNMITLMGLAVGIDYSLFVVSRYREERRNGRAKLEAIRATGGTASRAVLFSGMTVVLALAGMLIIPNNIFRSLAAGAIFVVVVAVLASLTLLPAILGLLGHRANAVGASSRG